MDGQLSGIKTQHSYRESSVSSPFLPDWLSRVRAFLYVGTAAFFITSVYQLVIFSQHYPFLKWVVGLLIGIILISVAANFETRRTQINTLIRNTNDEFQEWQ